MQKLRTELIGAPTRMQLTLGLAASRSMRALLQQLMQLRLQWQHLREAWLWLRMLRLQLLSWQTVGRRQCVTSHAEAVCSSSMLATRLSRIRSATFVSRRAGRFHLPLSHFQAQLKKIYCHPLMRRYVRRSHALRCLTTSHPSLQLSCRSEPWSRFVASMVSRRSRLMVLTALASCRLNWWTFQASQRTSTTAICTNGRSPPVQ
mmetsp:Transcript_52325/g.135614  ORF Transcript_52325/g.135614 Transcript_52325/m.135614 type:complete len:204 (+) Transcript_52325:174-785(+)